MLSLADDEDELYVIILKNISLIETVKRNRNR